MLFIQTQRGQRKLLPTGERSERAGQRAAHPLPRLAPSGTRRWAVRAHPSPFLPPAVPGVPEPLGKRVVVYLQLRDLRGSRGRRQVRMQLIRPGLRHPEVSRCQPRGEPRSVHLLPARLGWAELNPKARRGRRAGIRLSDSVSCPPKSLFEAESLSVHTQAQSCAQSGNLPKHAHRPRRPLKSNKPGTWAGAHRQQSTRRSVDT